MNRYKICDRCKGSKQARRPYFLDEAYLSINFTGKSEYYPCPACQGQGMIKLEEEFSFTVMNASLSSVLGDRYGIVVFEDFISAHKTAQNFDGVVVPTPIAEGFIEDLKNIKKI